MEYSSLSILHKTYQIQFLEVDNYYLNNPDVYNPSLNDEKNPFGSVENLKLTHEITIFNLNKYAKNYKVFNYDKTNMEELLNEIIS